MQALSFDLRMSARTLSIALFLLAGALLQTSSAIASTQTTSATEQAAATSSAPPPGIGMLPNAAADLAAGKPGKPDNPGTTDKPCKSDKSCKKVQTNSLTAVATVKDNISVEAGLLTSDSAKDLFGGWVADHFAVVQVTVGNHSREQQFVLQDIFFDYSNWALSGLYANGGVEDRSSKGLKDYQSPTHPGQISSIGALEVHDGFKSYATFNKRNFWVNGLVLVGTAAGGFAFLGPAGFTQGVTGYNSSFIPALEKFWPDRSIDQQSNLLKYGYQDKLVIAKEDPGKTYAFFPIRRFLTSGLAELYKKEPALFINPAELFLDPKLSTIVDGKSCGHFHQSDCKAIAEMKATMFSLAKSVIALDAAQPTPTDYTRRIIEDLVSPCYDGRKVLSTTGKGSEDEKTEIQEEDCPYPPDPADADKNPPTRLHEIRRLKRMLDVASLNSVRIVVSGIMTVDVQTVPPTIANVKFDKESEGASLWNNSTDKETGVIEGKFLTDGTPKITVILPPTTASKPDPTDKDKKPATPAVDDYIVKDSLKAVKDGSSDTELHFALQFTKKTIPNGTKISFQVEKSTKSGNSNSSTPAETVTSMTYTYTVTYTPTEPTITGVTFADENAVDWAKSTADLSGIITGKNLTGAIPSVSKITLADKSPATVSTYVTDKDLSVDTKTSTDTILNFTFKPTKVIPPGTELTFEVSTKDKDGTVDKAEAEKPYTTPEAAAKPTPKSPAKKNTKTFKGNTPAKPATK